MKFSPPEKFVNCALELVDFVELISLTRKNSKMEDEREKEDETLFQKYFEEKEIEFMFPSGIHGLHSSPILKINI